MLYQNFGLDTTPYWYFHVFHGNVKREIRDIYLYSLFTAVHEWETPYKLLPDKQVASGRLAYQYLTDAIRSGEYDSYGGGYILTSAIQSKKEIVEYLSEVEQLFPGIGPVLKLYRLLNDIFVEIGGMIEKRTHSSLIESPYVPKLLAILLDAAETEEKCVQTLQNFLVDYKDNAKHPIPRWGASSPR